MNNGISSLKTKSKTKPEKVGNQYYNLKPKLKKLETHIKSKTESFKKNEKKSEKIGNFYAILFFCVTKKLVTTVTFEIINKYLYENFQQMVTISILFVLVIVLRNV